MYANNKWRRCSHSGCTFKTNNKYKMYNHKEKEYPKPLYCNKEGCTFKAFTRDKLREHRGKQHRKPLQCSFKGYGKVFYLPNKLTKHEKTHDSTKYPCPYTGCKCTYNARASLTNHIKCKHKQTAKIYQCDFPGCGYISNRNYTIQQHKKTTHSNERPFKCQICHRRFKRKQSLTQHEHRHENKRKHKCQYCKKGFNTAGSRREHENGVHLKEKNYFCEVCMRAFCSSSDRTKHKCYKDGKVVKKICHKQGCTSEAMYCDRIESAAKYCKSHSSLGMKLWFYNECYDCRLLSHLTDHMNGKDLCTDCYLAKFPQGKCLKCEKFIYKKLKKDFDYVSVVDNIIHKSKCNKRPDFRVGFYLFELIVEIDEFQHKTNKKQYDTARELKRIQEIQQALGDRKLVVIRWNPDAYTDDQGKRQQTARTTKKGGYVDSPVMTERYNMLLTKMQQYANIALDEEKVKQLPKLTYIVLYYNGFDGTGNQS